MGSGEPVLVPEWYRAGKGLKTPSGNPDNNGVGPGLRNRLPLISCEKDSKRSPSRNVSVRSDKNSSAGARPYSNFGRRGRKKNLDTRDRDRGRPLLSSIDSGDRRNSGVASGASKDTFWRTHSAASGLRDELWPKSTNSHLKSTVLPRENVNSVGVRRAPSFNRDFPTLAAVDKKGVQETGRISSAVESLPLPSPSKVGGDSWTSALAEVPSVVGGNASTVFTVQTSPGSPVSSARRNLAGLNMAEALIQAPPRVRTPVQLSTDAKVDELTLRQCKQLVPVTPSMTKNSGLNSLEKPKLRGTSGIGDLGGAPKSTQQLPSQLLVRAPAARADIPKGSQTGNLQVLCRERVGVFSPAATKDVSCEDVNLKSSNNQNLVAERKGPSSNLFSLSKPSWDSMSEKKSVSRAQNRHAFFDSLRKKTSANHSSDAVVPVGSSDVPGISHGEDLGNGYCSDAFLTNQVGDCTVGVPTSASEINLEDVRSDSSDNHGDDTDSSNLEKQLQKSSLSDSDGETEQPSCDEDSKCHSAVDLDERDKAFLRSLGWEEDSMEEALTAEEISAFIMQYQKLRPFSKFTSRFDSATISLAQAS